MKQTLIIIFAAISFNCFSQPHGFDTLREYRHATTKEMLQKFEHMSNATSSSHCKIYNGNNCAIDINLMNITLDRCNNVSVKNNSKYLNVIPLHVVDKQNLTYTWNGNFWEVENK